MFSHRLLIISAFSLALVELTALATAQTASPDSKVVGALNLATEYSSWVRPPPDNDTANTVYVYVYLVSLVRVDSTAQEVTLQLWIMKHWIDSRLAWHQKFNSSLDNVSSILLPASVLWRPDVNLVSVIEQKDASIEPSPALIFKNGSVVHSVEIVARFKCRMDIDFFPFDVQECHVPITSRMQMHENLRLIASSRPFDKTITSATAKSNEFCVLGVDLRQENDAIFAYNTVKFFIQFQRKPSFYVMNLMLPSVLLLAISSIAFRLPPECGERVSFSITIVLSMCVFLQLAGNYTPTQSESVPLMSWFFSLITLMTILNVICNAFVLNCQFKQHSEVSVRNRLIKALFLNRLVCDLTLNRKTTTGSGEPQPPSSSNESNPENEWLIVVSSADKVFFAVYVALSVLFAATLIVAYAVTIRGPCLGIF